MSHSALAALGTYLLVLLVVCLRYWHRFRAAARPRAFNYRITDIWAAILALTPTLLAVAWHEQLQNKFYLSAEQWFYGVTALAFSQTAGLFVGRINIELAPHFGAENSLQSALSVLAGGYVGLLIFAGVLLFFVEPFFGILFPLATLLILLTRSG